jgi:hypothetical protein
MANAALETLEYADGLYRLHQDAKARGLVEKIMKADSVDEALGIYRQTHGYKIGFGAFDLVDKAKLVRHIKDIQHALRMLGVGYPPPSKEVNEYLYDYT